MRNTTRAHITKWTEHKTPAGHWSATHHDEETKDFTPHELSNFLNVRFPGERRRTSYFKQGRLPHRITVPSPDKQIRYVYIIEYYDGPVTNTYE